MKITKAKLKQIIKEELELTEDTGSSNQDYDALTTMIGRLDGMEGFMMGRFGLKSPGIDPALKQQAIEAAQTLHEILSQMRRQIEK